jgi:hypothetical protein
MATPFKIYSTEGLARQAVDALRAAGVPCRDIRLLTGCPMHDVRQELVGGFGGAVSPEAPVGSFANIRSSRRQGAGSFAGDPDRLRQGSFADGDRDVIDTCEDGSQRAHVVGDLGIRRLLRGLALDDDADCVVDELHAGHAVVLAEIAEIAPSDAQARLEQVAQAA